MRKHPVDLFAKGIYNIAYVYWYLHITLTAGQHA